MTTTTILRDYQKQAIKKIQNAFDKGMNKQVVVLATGLGKTIIFSHLLSERIAKQPKKGINRNTSGLTILLD